MVVLRGSFVGLTAISTVPFRSPASTERVTHSAGQETDQSQLASTENDSVPPAGSIGILDLASCQSR